MGLCRWILATLFLTALVPPGKAADAIELHLDATDAPRKRLQAHLVIPTVPGQMTLCYPKWIAGEHGPTGPITDLTGIKIRAKGKPVEWKRDDADTYAINLTVPEGVTTIEVDVEFIATPAKDGFSAAASVTPRLAVLNWNHVLLYPKERAIQQAKVNASLTLPAGWKMGCSLPIESDKGVKIHFESTTLEMLCDSPIICGKNYLEVPIGPKDGPPHFLCVVAESPEALKLSPELKTCYDRLITESYALFGAR
ncbi:MAG: M61 family peptidase, partial [Planctomycetes bacterium]|nr:M61 family peptidase [Planctomycetota bacterium]